MLGRHIGEYDPVRRNPAQMGLLPNVRFPVGRESQQPQNGIWDPQQDVAPRVERVGVVLVQLVTARVDDFVLGEADFSARGHVGGV